MPRVASTSADLARHGFIDLDAARESLDRVRSRHPHPDSGPCQIGSPGWLGTFETVADPDQALSAYETLDDDVPELTHRFCSDPDAGRRLFSVLGGSSALKQHLCAHPQDAQVLFEAPRRWSAEEIERDVLASIGAQPEEHGLPLAPAADAAAHLRLANRRQLVRIAARDLTAVEPEAVVSDIAGELADLADAIMRGALAIARGGVPDHADARLAIIGLGKCGAQELNYISDIDVLFVAEPAREEVSGERAIAIATRLAAAVTRICSEHSASGTIWQVDAALRPDGRAGALVRTLSGMRSYYTQWASNWEFQAMLKARPMAGDAEIGQAFVDLVSPLVWQAGERPNFIAQSQAMRRRVISLIPAKEVGREIKLGAGGLRDVEFSVQLLQLVHGRGDPGLRQRATLPSLAALVAKGYIGRRDGAELDHAYRFQRTLEHRVQLDRLRRTHLLPDDPAGLRRLQRSLGIKGEGEVEKLWRATASRVLRLQQRVFYSPVLDAVARIPTGELHLTPDAARARLSSLGFADAAAALRHIEALTNGSTRANDIQRQLMPAMLGWFAEGPNPDHGLLSFRRVSEALGSTPWYLRALRDEGMMAEHLAHILACSRYAVDLVKRDPSSVSMLADDDELRPRGREDLNTAMLSVAGRYEDQAEAIRAVRALRRRELLRIALGDLLGQLDVIAVGSALSDLASATIEGTLAIAARSVDPAPSLAVVALGRWGGGEMGYGSDCDALFVLAPGGEPGERDDTASLRDGVVIVAKLRSLLAAPGPDPALQVDADLRPEGRNGPILRSLASYLSYYGRWSSTWEWQALLRACFGAGDEPCAERLLAGIDRLRYPEGGLSASQVAEIRKLKARMETERVPRGTDPARNTKLGPGGLSDVEWTVQLLQLQHAHALPSLRTTSTLGALTAAVTAGLVETADAEMLRDAWLFASRLRNAIMLVRGRASDVIPADARDAAAIAFQLGYGRGEASVLVDDYRRTARRASGVVARLFWGE